MSKRKFKTLMISFSLAVAAVCLSVAFVACKGGGDGDRKAGNYGAGEEGIYYYDATTSEEYLMTLQSGTYMISVSGTSGYSGTYSYDEEGKAVSFAGSDGSAFEASFTDDAMQLSIASTPYTFLKKVDYGVKFVDGSATLATQSVTYGKAASYVDGERDGYIFLGWYEDAAFTTKYTFNTAVTGDVTLYAYYIAEDDTIPNYKVKFISDGEVVYETATQNGVVYDIPEVSGILGWWISDTNDGNELTYKYDGQILDEATNLYAVKADALGASVYGDRITWEAQVSSATITVDGTIVAPAATGNAYSYDMAALGTGEHTVEISASGYGDEKLVYVVNGLARVSNFAVYGTTLVYNRVENAQYYYISVTCANPAHDHTMVYNGNTLTYDFSNCEMGPDGITFTVYAYGTGYLESVSETYVYRLVLDGVEVSVDASTDTAAWAPVESATGYEVYVNGEYVATQTTAEYSLKNYGIGTVSVSVKPTAPGYYSEASEVVSYTKATLPAPEITGINEYTVSWTRIEGATNYIIYVNGKQIETVSYGTEEYALATDTDFVKADSYVITIKATNSSDTNQNSQESDPVYATDDTMSELLVYEDGVVYWQYAMAVGTYYVSINDGDETEVYGKNSFDVTFTQNGENVIKVYFNGSAVASLSVTTYAVIFDTRGGNAIDTIYVAKGDTIKLETPVFESGDANFIGWYTLPDLAGDYDADMYLGDGYLVSDGTVFSGDSTMILYAGWLSVKYVAHLDAGMGVVYDDEGLVIDSSLIAKNSSTFTLPVPVSEDTTYAFYGWYSGANGTGTRYADENGNAVRAYTIYEEATLYAYWRQIIDFELTTNDGEDVLAAKATAEIWVVSEVTVPSTYVYNGKEYTVAVLNSTSFNSCSSLVTINLPDTIRYIPISENGYRSGCGAFAQSANIQNVNIYATGEPDVTKESTYYSVDGVLFMKDPVTSGLELEYYPYGRTDKEYTVPSIAYNETEVTSVGLDEEQVYWSVTSLREEVFRGATSLEKITVQASVMSVGYSVFYTCNSLEEVVFTNTVDSEYATIAKTLTIADGAFRSCSALTTVTLPSRLASFSKDIFSSCSAFTTIIVDDPNGEGNYSAQNGLLYRGTATLVYCPAGRTEATIQAGTVTIASGAFQDGAITKITIPSSVTKIEESAFEGCTSLSELIFEANDQSSIEIETRAFYGCTALTEVELPSHLTFLGIYAFGGCTKLTEVTYDTAAGFTLDDITLETGAFMSTKGAYSVLVVNLGANVPEIDIAGVFGYALTNVYFDEANASFMSDSYGVVYNKEGTKVYFCPMGFTGEYTLYSSLVTVDEYVFSGRTGLTKITIPGTVQTIGAYAFYGCTALSEIVFEAGETELAIADYAFAGCTALTSVELPARLTALGTYEDDEHVSMTVFDECTALGAICVETGSTSFAVKDGILYAISGTDYTELLFCPVGNAVTETTIPNTVTLVMAKAFADNKNIQKITFEDGVAEGMTFGESVFDGCTSLGEVTLPEGLSEIPDALFKGCTSLETIFIPYTVAKIGTEAFYNCSSLTDVEFGEVPETTTGDYSLEFVSTGSGTSSRGHTFYGCDSLVTFTFPDRAVNTSYAMFDQDAALETVVLGKNMTEIASYTFAYCYVLKEVTIGEGNTDLAESKLEKIDSNAFSYTYALTEFVVPASVTSIGEQAFNHTGLKTLTFTGVVTSFSSQSFQNCTSLTDVEFCSLADAGTKTTSLANRMFLGCTALKTITIPVYVIAIGEYTFSGCTALESVYFGKDGEADGLETINQYAFQNCTSLGYISLPSSIKTIYTYAFSGCTKLAEINFELNGDGHSELSAINANAFEKTAIKSFTFPEVADGETITLGASLFASTSLETITLSNGVTSLGTALSNCYTIKTIIISESNESFALYLDEDTDGDGVADAASQPILYSYDFDNIVYIYGEMKGTYTAPESLTVITASAFAFQTSLEKVILPATVTEIGNYAFEDCTSLSEVEFLINTAGGDDKVAETLTIGIAAFAFSGIEEIIIPDICTSIGNYAFEFCKSLKHVYFGSDDPELNAKTSSALTMGTYVFYGSGLEEIILPGDVNYGTTTTKVYTFYKCNDLKSISFREPLSNETGTAALPQYFASNCESLEEVLNIPYTVSSAFNQYCFSNSGTNTNKMKVTFAPTPEGATEVELTFAATATSAGAFNGSGLQEIVIPARTVSIGNFAFKGAANLQTVTFEDGDKALTIGTNAFYGTTALEEIELPDRITSLSATNAFYQSGIRSITIPESVTFLANAADTKANSTSSSDKTYTFRECTNLEKVVLSSGMSNIGYYTFYKCTSLKIVTYTGDPDYDENEDYSETGYFALPDTMRYINQYAFANSGLITVNIPDLTEFSTSTIGIQTFSGCENLKYVNLGACTLLTQSMFAGCTSLESIDLSGVTSMTAGGSNKDGVFADCTSLKTVILSTDVPILAKAFQGCSSLVGFASTEDGLKDSNGNYVVDLRGYTITANSSSSYFFESCVSIKKAIFDQDVPVYVFRYCTGLEEVVFDGTGVTSIGEHAFDGCTALSSITIPYTMTTIGAEAFRECSGLKSIIFEATPTDVEEVTLTFSAPTSSSTHMGMFYGCTSLESVDLPSRTETSLKWGMFRECTALSSVTINCDITSIGTYVFYGCGALTSINLPDCVESIDDYAFAYSGLTSIVTPANLTTMGTYVFSGTPIVSATLTSSISNYTFYDCIYLTTVVMQEDVASVGNYAFAGCIALTGVTMTAVTTIGTNAFENCTSLESITFPSTLNSIGASAFSGCTALTSVTLPVGVTEIAANTFMGASSLSSVTFEGDVVSIGNYAFNGTALASFEIPSNLTSLGTYVFDNCNNLAEFTGSSDKYEAMDGMIVSGGVIIYYPAARKDTVLYIPEGYTIGANFLENNHTVTMVVFPEDMTAILDYALYGATSVLSVYIPSSVTSIGAYAFYGCTALESINLPSSLTSIGTYAFAGCDALTDFSALENTKLTSIGSYAFAESGIETIVLPDTYTVVDGYAFADTYSLAELILAEETTTIGSYAFQNSGLPSITVPATVETIEQYAFAGTVTISSSAGTITTYNGLEEINFEEGSSLTTIATYAFAGSKLKTFTMPENVTSMGVQVFAGTTELETFEFNETIEELPDYCFAYSGLKSIEIPGTITTLGKYVFYYCEELTDVILNDGLTAFGTYAFAHTGIKEMTIPGTLESTSSTYVFYQCLSLERFVFSEGVTSIGGNSFLRGCTSLTEVVIPSTLTGLKSDYCFYDCPYLNIVIPKTVETLGSAMFATWTSDQKVYTEYASNYEWLHTYMSLSTGTKAYEIDFDTVLNNVASKSSETTTYSGAVLCYYSEEEPETEGNFWHYDADGNVVEWTV